MPYRYSEICSLLYINEALARYCKTSSNHRRIPVLDTLRADNFRTGVVRVAVHGLCMEFYMSVKFHSDILIQPFRQDKGSNYVYIIQYAISNPRPFNPDINLYAKAGEKNAQAIDRKRSADRLMDRNWTIVRRRIKSLTYFLKQTARWRYAPVTMCYVTS